MKLGANTYAFLWSETLENSIKIMGENGYKAIEFLVSPPHFILSDYKPGAYKGLKHIMDDYGMKTLCLNIPSLDINIASPYAQMRKMTFDLYKRLTDICMELDAEIMLICPGKRHPLLPQPFDKCFDWARQSICDVVDYTKDTDLTIALETVPAGFMDTVADLKKLRDSVNSDRVKIVFDVTNVFMTEDQPEKKIHLIKDNICLMHLSDTTRKRWEHAPIGCGCVDSMAFIREAGSVGYDGYLSLEIINDKGIKGLNDSVRSLISMGWQPDNMSEGGWSI